MLVFPQCASWENAFFSSTAGVHRLDTFPSFRQPRGPDDTAHTRPGDTPLYPTPVLCQAPVTEYYQALGVSRSSITQHFVCLQADSRFAPSQWETALHCNDVSHWLGASLESVRCLYGIANRHPKLAIPGCFLWVSCENMTVGYRERAISAGWWCQREKCITGPFWGEYTDNRWIPITKGQWCNTLVFLLKICQRSRWTYIWSAADLYHHDAHETSLWRTITGHSKKSLHQDPPTLYFSGGGGVLKLRSLISPQAKFSIFRK